MIPVSKNDGVLGLASHVRPTVLVVRQLFTLAVATDADDIVRRRPFDAVSPWHNTAGIE